MVIVDWLLLLVDGCILLLVAFIVYCCPWLFSVVHGWLFIVLFIVYCLWLFMVIGVIVIVIILLLIGVIVITTTSNKVAIGSIAIVTVIRVIVTVTGYVS